MRDLPRRVLVEPILGKEILDWCDKDGIQWKVLDESERFEDIPEISEEFRQQTYRDMDELRGRAIDKATGKALDSYDDFERTVAACFASVNKTVYVRHMGDEFPRTIAGIIGSRMRHETLREITWMFLCMARKDQEQTPITNVCFASFEMWFSEVFRAYIGVKNKTDNYDVKLIEQNDPVGCAAVKVVLKECGIADIWHPMTKETKQHYKIPVRNPLVKQFIQAVKPNIFQRLLGWLTNAAQ